MKTYSSPELHMIGAANTLVLGLPSTDEVCDRLNDPIEAFSDVTELW